MTSSDYDRETMVAMDGGSWATEVSDAWNINDNPNGGYLVASSLRAVAETAPDHPDPISMTTHYLRPGVAPHPARIDVEMVRQGRRTSTLRSVMYQDGKPRVTSLITMSDLDAWPADPRLTVEPHPMPPPEECIGRAELPQGVELPILSLLDLRLDPATVEPGANTEASVSGWIRFRDGSAPTSLALPLFADAFPPSPLGLYGPVGWIPTVELTVHVRARPAPGWVRGRFQSRDIADGMLIEDGLLWDADGTLVAQSRQLALILS